MKPRVFVVHCWGGSPLRDWMPWAEKSLKAKGFEVYVPEMPNTDSPVIGKWVEHLAEAVGEVDDNAIFVGHSIGCQTILRYLESLPQGKKCKEVILIAPWISLKNLTDDEKPIAKPWEETPIDLDKIKTKADKFIAIFSDDDPTVPYDENIKVFKDKLGAETITKHKMGHFTGEKGFTEIPFLLELL